MVTCWSSAWPRALQRNTRLRSRPGIAADRDRRTRLCGNGRASRPGSRQPPCSRHRRMDLVLSVAPRLLPGCAGRVAVERHVLAFCCRATARWPRRVAPRPADGIAARRVRGRPREPHRQHPLAARPPRLAVRGGAGPGCPEAVATARSESADPAYRAVKGAGRVVGSDRQRGWAARRSPDSDTTVMSIGGFTGRPAPRSPSSSPMWRGRCGPSRGRRPGAECGAGSRRRRPDTRKLHRKGTGRTRRQQIGDHTWVQQTFTPTTAAPDATTDPAPGYPHDRAARSPTPGRPRSNATASIDKHQLTSEGVLRRRCHAGQTPPSSRPPMIAAPLATDPTRRRNSRPALLASR